MVHVFKVFLTKDTEHVILQIDTMSVTLQVDNMSVHDLATQTSSMPWLLMQFAKNILASQSEVLTLYWQKLKIFVLLLEIFDMWRNHV